MQNVSDTITSCSKAWNGPIYEISEPFSVVESGEREPAVP